MVGRTNVGGGGGSGSSFLAYLQVATDPNAVITAVNLAGDTFSGTADNTGALVLDITEPGTYTVTETDGGEKTVVISDNGVVYNVEINAFNGNIIIEGVAIVGMSAEAYSIGSLTPKAPTITENYISYQHNSIQVSISNSSMGVYVTTQEININDYSEVSYFVGTYGTSSGSPAIVAFDENDNFVQLGYVTAGSVRSISISSLDKTKKWRFGAMVYSSNYNTVAINIIDLKLQ